MFKNVLVATDGSGTSEQAVEVAAGLAAACGAKLTIVHVAPHMVQLEDVERSAASSEFPPDVREEIKRVHDAVSGVELSIYAPVPAPQSAVDFMGNALLQHAEGKAKAAKAKDVSVVLGHGDAADEIADAAARSKADLIVIGSRGLSELGGLVMGSVSHKVMHLVDCPCMIVKGK